MIQTIRDLAGERMNLALEVSSVLQHRIADRAAAKEELKVAKAELNARTRRLERDKELQTALEIELDRRSSDWTFKLEKYQSEEQRLRERVRELAEQNVSLQREVSSFHEREAESRKFELKAETLLTNLLLEKLYSMESEVEQLQAELAAAVRGNDILRAEVQNTQDDLSYATHKLKDLELQVILSCKL